ncbi:endoplasmic reticulum-Golgi intermediate compartment protein 3 [Histomonas meleagridis]|uniref:endoplasmic reticulum-Golgi intermediate compartment protein 3 n=1 Tax=Histomonas meleagridis TaxID=135588 RepID=UPI003559F7E0|nr:endoplasmic reticulum-Golgi intermediate compartment protein 3 [Histomonas meleagridis]KAH0799508.1 endoplasmic reticulum-Golgi intermediate compartment protein 3 [Histomonas meleagridis]
MVQDITGNHQLTATQSISRQRLDSSHRPIDPTEIFDNDQKSIFSKCGSCYGSNYSECCLTCFDVVSAFKLQNKLVPNLRNVDQCVRDKKAISDGESCRIKAKVRTSFSSGRITLRAGGNTKMPIHYKNDFSYLGESANLSHWIHELRFGEGVKEFINPLDNSQYLQYGPGFYHFKYTATIVPSVYTLDNGEKIETNQYSVTFSPKQITKTISKQHPSIDFVFETSPISVETVKTTKGYLQLITGICAIIGGGFTLGGLLDRLLYRIDRMKPHK